VGGKENTRFISAATMEKTWVTALPGPQAFPRLSVHLLITQTSFHSGLVPVTKPAISRAMVSNCAPYEGHWGTLTTSLPRPIPDQLLSLSLRAELPKTCSESSQRCEVTSEAETGGRLASCSPSKPHPLPGSAPSSARPAPQGVGSSK
jgi:hypothetical protein